MGVDITPVNAADIIQPFKLSQLIYPITQAHKNHCGSLKSFESLNKRVDALETEKAAIEEGIKSVEFEIDEIQNHKLSWTCENRRGKGRAKADREALIAYPCRLLFFVRD